MWMTPLSWEHWAERFRAQGHEVIAPAWPGLDREPAELRADPSPLRGLSIPDVIEHYERIIGGLDRSPIIIGHSFGGLFTQKLAGMALAAGAVAIDPAPFRGVLPLPLSTLRSAFPVLGNPLNRSKAVMLTEEQFKYGFGNVLSDEESKALYEKYAVPGAGKPLFQGAFANFNWKTEAKVDTKQTSRGPLLIVSGEQDHTVPPAIAKASAKRYKVVPADLLSIAGRGHSLTIDAGWREVADQVLAFLATNGLTP
jgi:pimeloyl-ACP methyl ester carboxylesterase